MAQPPKQRLQPIEPHVAAAQQLITGQTYTYSEWISFFASKPDMTQQVKHEGRRETGSIPNEET